MRRFTPRHICPDSRERGAATLLLVLGLSAAMLLIAAMVSFQARQELRMSRAEVEAANTTQLIRGEFSRTIAEAYDPAFNPNDDGTAECTPSPVCRQVLRPYSFEGTDPLTGDPKTMETFPMRVIYQKSSAVDKLILYGWIQRQWNPDRTVLENVKAYYDYAWCPKAPEGLFVSPCKIGG